VAGRALEVVGVIDVGDVGVLVDVHVGDLVTGV